MQIDGPVAQLELAADAHHRLPVLLFCLDPIGGFEEPFLSLSQLGAVDLRPVASMDELEAMVFANTGQMIVSVTASTDEQKSLTELAEKIVRRNASCHSHVHLMALLTGSPDLVVIDRLEALGTRVLLRHHVEAIEHQVRLSTWRIMRCPTLSVPCFYLRYPDSNTLEVFLLGPLQRQQLRYGEKLASLFETLAVTRRWTTTQQIADELEIARSSVKVYTDRLRDEYELNRHLAGVNVPAGRVFCSEKHGSAWMHRFNGQVLILD
jgi:hypothetical protein